MRNSVLPPKLPPPVLFHWLCFIMDSLDRIPSKSGLVWLITEAGRVEWSMGATASQNGIFIVELIRPQNPEKHWKSGPKPYTGTSKIIKSSLFSLSGPHWGHNQHIGGVPVLVIGNDRPPISASSDRIDIPHIYHPGCPIMVPSIWLIADRNLPPPNHRSDLIRDRRSGFP